MNKRNKRNIWILWIRHFRCRQAEIRKQNKDVEIKKKVDGVALVENCGWGRSLRLRFWKGKKERKKNRQRQVWNARKRNSRVKKKERSCHFSPFVLFNPFLFFPFKDSLPPTYVFPWYILQVRVGKWLEITYLWLWRPYQLCFWWLC